MKNFNELEIENKLKSSIKYSNFITPTPIQSQAIPIALEGKDVLGTAQTGTGKTLAFTIPLINKLIIDKNAMALIICPTRELASQVMGTVSKLTHGDIRIGNALLIGGESMQRQLRQLNKRARIIVGTPGRINDHLKRKSLNLSRVNYLVLDETDRMLDMGFTPQIELILKFVPKEHQTLLFSATLPNNILKISEKYLRKPERISVGSLSTPIEKIKQETFQLTQDKKYHELINQLVERQGSILVFVKTKHGADKMVKRLKYDAHSAEAIHGNLRQSKRDRVIRGFRAGKNRILVATDVAARGLDIPLIQHVINYDLPQVPEDYIHRVGRTGRAGKDGSALTFLTNNDRSMWREIQKLINPNFKLEESFNKKSNKKNKKFKKRGKSFKDSGNRNERRDNKGKFKFKNSKFKKFNSDKSNNTDSDFDKKKNFKFKKFNTDKSNNSDNDFDKKKNFKFKSNKFKNFRNDNLNEREESSGNRKKFKFKKKFKNRKRPKNFSFKKFNKN